MSWTHVCERIVPMIPDGLEFDEELHKYSMSGRPVPGVTEVLESVGITDFEFVAPEILEYAKQLGTAVHSACEMYDNGILEPESVDPVVAPYLEGWKKFKNDYGVEVIENELRVYDPIFCYAGTLDRIIRIGQNDDGIRILLDIKSGEKTRAAPIQTSAYLRAYQIPCISENVKNAHEMMPLICMERWCIHLDKEGGYQRVIHRDYESNISVFLGALSVYVYNHNNK
jgi:hypothetical protein